MECLWFLRECGIFVTKHGIVFAAFWVDLFEIINEYKY
jgi:hypothetical protein